MIRKHTLSHLLLLGTHRNNADCPPFTNNLPISDEQVRVSWCRNGDGLHRYGLSEIRAKLVHDQLFHNTRYEGAFKIHEVRWVRHVYDEAPCSRMNSWKCVGASAPPANQRYRSADRASPQLEAGHGSKNVTKFTVNLTYFSGRSEPYCH